VQVALGFASWTLCVWVCLILSRKIKGCKTGAKTPAAVSELGHMCMEVVGVGPITAIQS